MGLESLELRVSSVFPLVVCVCVWGGGGGAYVHACVRACVCSSTLKLGIHQETKNHKTKT